MKEKFQIFSNEVISYIENDVNRFLKNLDGELLDITYQVKDETHWITLTYQKPKKCPAIPQIKILKANWKDKWNMQEQMEWFMEHTDGVWKKTIHLVSGYTQYALVTYETGDGKDENDGTE